MALIVAYGLLRLAPDLGHPGIWNWDESFHQVVTRHSHDTPWHPMLVDDPVHPLTDYKLWWGFNTWLHKPPGPFWLGAFFMTFTGVTPLALRLGSLFGELVMALSVYWFVRSLIAPPLAFVASLAFLSIPFGWEMTQGRFVGDVTDITLSACLCFAMLALVKACETQRWPWALAAGAATGAGYLCKTLLSLTPLGVALVLVVLGLVKFSRGLKPLHWVTMLLGTVLVAGPWNLYAFLRWPDIYKRIVTNTIGFVSNAANEDLAPGIRPLDAVFLEVNPHNYEPLTGGVILLLGLWLAWRALVKRELITIVLTGWLWATWLGHSYADVKGHAHLWNSLVPGYAALALVMRDVFKSRVLAFAALAGLFTTGLMTLLPFVSKLRELLPPILSHSRRMPGFVESLAFMGVAVVIGFLFTKWKRAGAWVPAWPAGVVVAALLGWASVVQASQLQSKMHEDAKANMFNAYSREVGRVMDAASPKKSLLLIDIDFESPGQFEYLNLTFWSDRLVLGGHDVKDYPQAGYHPYLVSPAAEPFAPVPGVPADSWLRAYDLTVPAAGPTPLPEGATPLDFTVGTMKVLGFASARHDSERERYVFFVQPQGVPTELKVVFESANGPVEKVIAPEAALRNRARLATSAWFIAPVFGPLRSDVTGLDFGAGQRVTLKP